MGENVVGPVFATADAALLPEMAELVLQRPAGPQVQHKFPGKGVVQGGVVHMGKQPGTQTRLSTAAAAAHTCPAGGVRSSFLFPLTSRTPLARCDLLWTPAPSVCGKENKKFKDWV